MKSKTVKLMKITYKNQMCSKIFKNVLSKIQMKERDDANQIILKVLD